MQSGINFPTYNNWVTHYYDDMSLIKSHEYSTVSLNINSNVSVVGNIKHEINAALTKIQQSTTNDIVLFYSGGVDSEIIALSLLELNIPFSLCFIRFANNLNDHEFAHVDAFAKQHNLTIQYLDIDLVHWIEQDISETGFQKLQNKYKLTDLSTPLYFWARLQLESDVTVIAGNGDPHLTKSFYSYYSTMPEWVYSITPDSELIRLSFTTLNNFKDCPVFFKYTPELALSFLKDNDLIDVVSNKIPFKNSIISSKFKILSKYYNLNQRPKYTGFEKLKNKSWTKLIDQENLSQNMLTYKYHDIIDLFTNGTNRHANYNRNSSIN